MTLIEAAKLELEALTKEKWFRIGLGEANDPKVEAAIAALNAVIEQAEKQEAWKTSDTAYRPDGLPQDFTKHEVDSFDDWSEWVCPDPTQYFMKCCDCGLVHKMQFNIVKYSEGDRCEDFNDPNVQVVFRARRATPPAAQPCPTCEALARTVMIDQTAHDTQRQPLTDEQIDAVCAPLGFAQLSPREVARAIEAAHGIGEKK